MSCRRTDSYTGRNTKRNPRSQSDYLWSLKHSFFKKKTKSDLAYLLAPELTLYAFRSSIVRQSRHSICPGRFTAIRPTIGVMSW